MPTECPRETAWPLVLEAFTAAEAKTFDELCQSVAAAGEPFISLSAPTGFDVVAEIILRRTSPGTLRLAFSRAALETLALRYLPNDLPRTPEILEDTAGEFANVI